MQLGGFQKAHFCWELVALIDRRQGRFKDCLQQGSRINLITSNDIIAGDDR